MLTDRNVWSGIAAGVIAGTALALGGYWLALDNTGAMGPALFLGVPVAVGFAIGLIVRSSRRIGAVVLFVSLLSLAVMLITRVEGIICCLMALPLIVVGAGLGSIAGDRVRQRWIDQGKGGWFLQKLFLGVLPFLLLGAARMEAPYRNVPRVESVVTEARFAAPARVVWDHLKSVDRFESPEHPLLLRLGMPKPVRCVLVHGAVGGRRVCLFDRGVIEERITEWDPPRRMGMVVTSFSLPHRKWLGFKDATYELREENGRTIVRRATTITSRLYPAWYWRPLERWGVETEHQYLFSGLAVELAPR